MLPFIQDIAKQDILGGGQEVDAPTWGRESIQMECCRSIKIDKEFFRNKCTKISSKIEYPCCQYYLECSKIVKESSNLTKGVIFGVFCFIVILCFVYVYCKFLFKWNEERELETRTRSATEPHRNSVQHPPHLYQAFPSTDVPGFQQQFHPEPPPTPPENISTNQQYFLKFRSNSLPTYEEAIRTMRD